MFKNKENMLRDYAACNKALGSNSQFLKNRQQNSSLLLKCHTHEIKSKGMKI